MKTKHLETLHDKLYKAVESEINDLQEKVDNEMDKDRPNDDKVERLESIIGYLETAQNALDDVLIALEEVKNS